MNRSMTDTTSSGRVQLNLLLWLVPASLLGILGYLFLTALTNEPVRTHSAPVAMPGNFPRTLVEDDGTKVTIPAPPVRVLPGDSGMADILTELLPPSRIIAFPDTVDQYAGAAEYYAAHKNIARFPVFTAEPLLLLKPDLILTDSFQDADIASILKTHGITVLRFDRLRTFDGIRASIIAIGAATGEDQRAALLVDDFDRRLKAVESEVAGKAAPRTLCYSNYSDGYAVGTGESQDEILRRAGGKNALAELNISGHVKFTFEQILKLNPDWIVVGGDSGQDSSQVNILLNQPSLAELPAIKLRHIAVVPDRYFSAVSQYVVNAVEILAKQLHPERTSR